jgi:uncharacterized protein YceH (UPF0502 family)
VTEAETQTPTSWKQLRVKTNLGTLVSVLVAVGFITFQGIQIRTQIDGNSQAVSSMVSAVEELSATVGLTIELDQRTNQLYDEIGGLRDQYSDQADVWIEISTQSERFDAARNDLSDLEWRVDDLDRRVAEAFGAGMADTGSDDYGFQITDLIRQVAELQGRQNASNDLEWQFDDLSRRVTELQVRMDTSGGADQGQVDDLYERTDELFDMVWRMWDALQSRTWSSDYLGG